MATTDYDDLVLDVSHMSLHEGTVPQKEVDDPMTLATSIMMYKIGEFSKYMVHLIC